MVTKSPILPTSVVGSYATPSWLFTAIQEMDKGNYGETDINETFNDAVKVAISDQEKAGIDIISDGEMRRWHFVQSFYKKMTGIEREPDLRKIGVYGYDSPARYKAVSKIEVPEGLGIIEEFGYLKTQTDLPVKMTCPGPLTLTIHVRPGNIYKNRIDMAWELADVINQELKLLSQWLKINRLVLNISKTNFVIFHSYRRIVHHNVTLLLDKKSISEKSHIKYLGVLVDQHLNWKYQISNVSKKISRSIGIMYRLRNFVDLQNAHHLSMN